MPDSRLPEAEVIDFDDLINENEANENPEPQNEASSNKLPVFNGPEVINFEVRMPISYYIIKFVLRILALFSITCFSSLFEYDSK